MKKYLWVILLLQSQLVLSQNIDPEFPYEGQNVTARVLFFCPKYPDINAQGQDSLVVFDEPDVISLYVVYEISGGCVGGMMPTPGYYDIGVLTEGTYTLNVFKVNENDTLPVQNGVPDNSFEFQVRGAPVAVDTLSNFTLMLLAFGFLLATLSFIKLRTRYTNNY